MATAAAAILPQEPATILVVDDTPDNIDVLGEILKPHYKVRVAISGERALAIAREKLPDLVLLDVMMPGLSGFEVCEQLKSYLPTRRIPVILVGAGNLGSALLRYPGFAKEGFEVVAAFEKASAAHKH